MTLKAGIELLANDYFDEICRVRQYLHANPELSFKEYNTSGYIASFLKKEGIHFEAGFVETGIVAIIEGKDPGRGTVALRADMDALPIKEQNDVPYASKNDGVMHACGHDVHTSCLLGAAKILQRMRDQWSGTIVLIFQPGEEKLPGGAKLMIEEGVLEMFGITKIIGQHVFPTMETGNVGFREGMYMASSDEIYITVKGKGGHAALPATYNNPLLIASELLLNLQDAFKAIQDTTLPSVLAFGKILGDGATNVIPDEVTLEGTLRTLDETFRARAHNLLNEQCVAIGDSNNTSVLLNIVHGYPVLKNDLSLTTFCRNAAKDYLGDSQVHELQLRMTAEDFAYYSQKVPSCFYRLGTGNISKGITSQVHTSTFDIDEEALRTGMGLIAYLGAMSLE